MKVVEQTARNLRLKDMPDEWFALPDEKDMTNPMVAAIAVFRCSRLLDAGKVEEAAVLTEALLASGANLVGLHRSLLKSDLAYCYLLQGELERSDAILEDKEQKKFMKSMRSSIGVLRTQYADALLGDGDCEKAAKWEREFEKRAKTHPYPSDVESERELLELARAKAAEIKV